MTRNDSTAAPPATRGSARDCSGRRGGLGALVWNGGRDAADHVGVSVVDNITNDDPDDSVDHPHLVTAVTDDSNANTGRYDTPSVNDGNESKILLLSALEALRYWARSLFVTCRLAAMSILPSTSGKPSRPRAQNR